MNPATTTLAGLVTCVTVMFAVVAVLWIKAGLKVMRNGPSLPGHVDGLGCVIFVAGSALLVAAAVAIITFWGKLR